MGKTITLSLLLVLTALVLTGCGTTAKYIYPAKMSSLIQVASEPVYNIKVAVAPFDDERGDINTFGTCFLRLLPLAPFGYVDYERPDAARLFATINAYEFTPSEDLAKAAALSLRRSNLFKDAFFTFGGEKDNADLVMYGKVKTAKYNGKILTYGLSIVGDFLWLIGAPCSISANTLELEFQVKRKDKVIWDYTFSRSESIWQWYYYQFGSDCLAFAQLTQEAMNGAILDLSGRLRNNPKLLD